MLPDGTYGGNPGGFLLTLPEAKIYIAGDTALFGDMQLYGRDGLDLAILPIGDLYTMGPEDSIEAIKLLKPKRVAAVPLQHLAADRPGRQSVGRESSIANSRHSRNAGAGREVQDLIVRSHCNWPRINANNAK